MTAIRVRTADPADLAQVLALWSALAAGEQALGIPVRADEPAQQSWIASFERHLGRFSFLWVVERDERIGGFLLARLKTRPAYLGGELIGELCSIYVAPPMRGMRAGEALVRTAIAALRAAGAGTIEVDAHEANPAARAFWEAQGFRTGFRTYRLLDATPGS